MLKLVQFFKLFIVILTISSCSNSDDSNNNIDNELIDDYKLITVNDNGGIFNIGNNTGEINQIGQFENETSSNFLNLNCILMMNNSIYAIENLSTPPLGPRNNLLHFNLADNSSDYVLLDIPESIPGDSRSIGTLVRKENNLVGILYENDLIQNSPKHIIEINTDTFEVSHIATVGIEDGITSTLIIGNSLYISNRNNGFFEFNLTNNTISNLELNGAPLFGEKIAKVDNTKIGFMQRIVENPFQLKPIMIDLNNEDISLISDNQLFVLPVGPGNTIFENNEYLNIVLLSLKSYILKTNFQTDENILIEFDSSSISSNMIIVDLIE